MQASRLTSLTRGISLVNGRKSAVGLDEKLNYFRLLASLKRRKCAFVGKAVLFACRDTVSDDGKMMADENGLSSSLLTHARQRRLPAGVAGALRTRSHRRWPAAVVGFSQNNKWPSRHASLRRFIERMAHRRGSISADGVGSALSPPFLKPASYALGRRIW